MSNLVIKMPTAALLFLFLFLSADNPKLPKGVVDIKDVRKIEEPAINKVLHKQYDVEVYRTFLMEQMYQVVYYRKENDTLTTHGAYLGSNKNYDKAAYEWLNDTMVSLRLFSSTSKKELKFKVYAKGNKAGLITEK